MFTRTFDTTLDYLKVGFGILFAILLADLVFRADAGSLTAPIAGAFLVVGTVALCLVGAQWLLRQSDQRSIVSVDLSELDAMAAKSYEILQRNESSRHESQLERVQFDEVAEKTQEVIAIRDLAISNTDVRRVTMVAYYQVMAAKPNADEMLQKVAYAYMWFIRKRPDLESLMWQVVAEVLAKALSRGSVASNKVRGSYAG